MFALVVLGGGRGRLVRRRVSILEVSMDWEHEVRFNVAQRKQERSAYQELRQARRWIWFWAVMACVGWFVAWVFGLAK